MLRLDDLGINNLKLWQDPSLFCFGTDAVLLANFAAPKKGAAVLDIGTGNGIIPVLLSAKTNAKHITGLEIQQKSAALAQKNVRENALTDQIDIVVGDINDTALFAGRFFDYITCNPPYKPAGTGLKNPDTPLAIARHEIFCTLADILQRARVLLNSKGRIAMVHKPERLGELIALMDANGIAPKRLQTVHAHLSQPPCLILIEGMKDGAAGLTILPPLAIYDEDGNYTATAAALYRKGQKP